MKRIYAILAVAAVAACSAFAVSSFASRDPFFEANVEALMQTETFETIYVRHESVCKILIDGDLKMKLIAAGFSVTGDGSITLPGQLSCEGGGNMSCRPIECQDLLETILKNL